MSPQGGEPGGSAHRPLEVRYAAAMRTVTHSIQLHQYPSGAITMGIIKTVWDPGVGKSCNVTVQVFPSQVEMRACLELLVDELLDTPVRLERR